jgi:hypothetical protein
MYLYVKQQALHYFSSDQTLFFQIHTTDIIYYLLEEYIRILLVCSYAVRLNAVRIRRCLAPLLP